MINDCKIIAKSRFKHNFIGLFNPNGKKTTTSGWAGMFVSKYFLTQQMLTINWQN